MYDNTHFKTKKEAIEYGLSDSEYGVKAHRRNLARIYEDAEKQEKFLEREKSLVRKFTKMLEEEKESLKEEDRRK